MANFSGPRTNYGKRGSTTGPMGPLGPQGPGGTGPMGPVGQQGPSPYDGVGPMGPLGPQSPNGLFSPPQGKPAAPGASKAQLQAAYDAFHQGGASGATAGVARPDYDAMFRASLDRQRAGIDASLRSVMGDIDTRRAQASQVVGMLPGEVNKVYDQGQGAVNAQAAAATKSLQQAGASAPTAGQQAGVDAIRMAMEQSRAGGLADQPYLTIGTNDLFNRQAGAANAAAQGARNDLDLRLADYYGQNAQQDRQFDMDKRMARFQANLSGDAGAAKRDEELRQAILARAATPAGTARWWQANALVDPTGAEKMSQNFNMDPKTLKTWQKDPEAWQAAKDRLTPSLVSFLRFQYGLK